MSENVETIMSQIQRDLSAKDAMVVHLTIASVLSTIERENFINTMVEIILNSLGEPTEENEAAHNYVSAICEAFEIADEKYNQKLSESIKDNEVSMPDVWNANVGES